MDGRTGGATLSAFGLLTSSVGRSGGGLGGASSGVPGGGSSCCNVSCGAGVGATSASKDCSTFGVFRLQPSAVVSIIGARAVSNIILPNAYQRARIMGTLLRMELGKQF